VEVANPTSPTPKGRVRRALFWIGAVVALAIVLVALWLGSALRTPSWWPDSAVAEDASRAEEVENAVASQLTSARPLTPREGTLASQDWSVSLSEDDANSWLRMRLREWLRHRGVESRLPVAVESIGVEFTPGALRLGARLPTGQVAWVKSEVRVDENGEIWVWARSAGVGRSSLPLDFVLSRLGGVVSADAAAALRRERPLLDEGVVKVDEARRVRLRGVELREGELVVTARTESRCSE
jgi:hypothetical protein